MQRILEFWKTARGKVAILGGGGTLTFLIFCFVCAVCGLIFGDRDGGRVAEATAPLVAFSTEAPTPEPTATLPPSSTPEPAAATPTETSPNTPEPSPTSTPEEIQPPRVTAGDSDVNMRSGPGTNYEVVGTLAVGETVEIVGRTPDSAWWQVAALDGLCWVAAGVVNASNVDEGIPVVETPPPPVQPTSTEVPPQPTAVPTEPPSQPTNPPSSTGHTFSDDEVDPPWWPCNQGQIKGNRNSMKYHVPGGQFYAKTYDDVQCFNTAEEASAAGFIASKR